jgi:serine protease Do
MLRFDIRTIVLLLSLILVGSTVARAADPEPKAVRVDEVIAKCLPAYVFVGGGSGAIISPDGFVVTNAHVTRRSKRWKLRTPDGEYHTARVMGSSPGTDLCLLKIEHAEDLPYLPLGDSDRTEVGDVVIAIGNPFALGNIDGKPTVTLGVVSALHVDRPHAYDAIQTDTPINPGNSGGPLINLRGELIGVNAQIQTRFGLRQNTGVGYAISSNQVRRFLPALKEAEGKSIPSGRIPGIVLSTEADKPPVVKDVREDSRAAEAGVKAGDVICAVDKSPIETLREYASVLGRYPIGTDVSLRVRRPAEEGAEPVELSFPFEITKHGPPFLGFKFNLKSRSSLTIASVDEGGPAEKAGMKPGDRLVAIGRVRIRSRRVYYYLLRRIRPGMRLRVIVRRGKKNVALQLVVGERE